MKDREVGDAAHVIPSRQFRIALRIDLYYNGSSRHVDSCARNFRSRHAAGATPGSPEINQYWNASILDDFVEQYAIHFHWLINGRQGGLAGAATAGIGQMRRRNTVLASTGLTRSNYGHFNSLSRDRHDPRPDDTILSLSEVT
jgi:hypothetical protein